jgi:hypothetical protein
MPKNVRILAADFRGFWPLSPIERSEKPSFFGVSGKTSEILGERQL